MMVVGGFSSRFWYPICRGCTTVMPLWYIQPTVALFGCCLLFYGGGFLNDQLMLASFHLVTFKNENDE